MQVYNEKQISAILRRAATLQSDVPEPEAGLTLEELQRVASEVGIAPHLVAQAAAETTAGLPTGAGDAMAFWGAPVHLVEERMLIHPLDEDEWAAIVQEAQRIYGQPGEISGVGSTRTWSYGQRGRRTVSLTATTRRGRTVVTAHRDLTQEIGVTYGPLGSMGAVFAIVLATEGLAGMPVALRVAVAVALLLATYLAARGIVHQVGRGQRRKMWQLLEAVERLAGESEGEGGSVAPPARTGRIAPLALDDVASEATPPVRHRTR